jgi:pyruvate dehydrogenase E2 component (dihydrolipoamide acetyltransferase)
MSIQVIMPQMGESVFEGTLTKWLKKVGDSVTRDEPLFEISTDKVDSEIPSPASGILSEILVPEGKTIQINTVLAIIEEEGSGKKEARPEIRKEGKAVSAQVPKESMEMKREVSETSPESAEPKSSAAFGPAEKPEVPESRKPTPARPSEGGPSIRMPDVRTSPLVRRIARENNVELSQIHGTGLEGRITKEDLLSYLAQRSTPEIVQAPAEPRSAEAAQPAKAETAPPEPAVEAIAVSLPEEKAMPSPTGLETPKFIGEIDTVPMTPMRKAIAERMVSSKRTSAHVNTVFEVDMSSVVELRENHKVEFQKREGLALTYTPFFAKALVDNVREFPVFNCSLSGENILYKKPINLGIAVALDTGLIVPVIKNSHLKSFTGLALAINDLAERARNKRLKPEEVQNGTISMTNPGSFGALFATPIINQPQVAILGIGGIEKRPVVIHDAIAIRSMVCLSLTFDHRVIDGAVADRFMARLKQRLQSWTQWID